MFVSPFHAIAAQRGDGLLPEFQRLMKRDQGPELLPEVATPASQSSADRVRLRQLIDEPLGTPGAVPQRCRAARPQQPPPENRGIAQGGAPHAQAIRG